MRKSTKDRRDLIPSARPSGAPKSRRKVQYMSQEERLREAEKIEVINKESLGNLIKWLHRYWRARCQLCSQKVYFLITADFYCLFTHANDCVK